MTKKSDFSSLGDMKREEQDTKKRLWAHPNNDGQISNVIEKINIRNMDNAASMVTDGIEKVAKNTRFLLQYAWGWVEKTPEHQKHAKHHRTIQKSRLFSYNEPIPLHPSIVFSFLFGFVMFVSVCVCLCVCIHCSTSHFYSPRYDDYENKCCIVFQFSLTPVSCKLGIVCFMANIRQCSNWQTFPF